MSDSVPEADRLLSIALFNSLLDRLSKGTAGSFFAFNLKAFEPLSDFAKRSAESSQRKGEQGAANRGQRHELHPNHPDAGAAK